MIKCYETFYANQKKTALANRLPIMLLFLMILNSGCYSTKYTKNFRETKKHLDTYVLMTPMVKIDARDRNSKASDPALAKTTSRIVESVVNQTLSTKYKLKQIEGFAYNYKTFDSLFNFIDNHKIKELSGISILPIQKNNFIGQTDRYGLLISLNGFYNPNYNTFINSNSGGLATNRMILNSYTKPVIIVRIIVIDFEINEIVYYNKFSTLDYDPRVESDVVQVVRRRIRKIYYK